MVNVGMSSLDGMMPQFPMFVGSRGGTSISHQASSSTDSPLAELLGLSRPAEDVGQDHIYLMVLVVSIKSHVTLREPNSHVQIYALRCHSRRRT